METMKELAEEALQVQDACNLSGVAIRFAEVMKELRVLLQDQLGVDFSTSTLNRHPIAVLWCDKLADLTGRDFTKAHDWIWDITGRNAKMATPCSDVGCTSDRGDGSVFTCIDLDCPVHGNVNKEIFCAQGH